VSESKKVCENCRWWSEMNNGPLGFCRRFPPARDPKLANCSPQCQKDYWCGEWMAKDENFWIALDVDSGRIPSRRQMMIRYRLMPGESRTALFDLVSPLITSLVTDGTLDYGRIEEPRLGGLGVSQCPKCLGKIKEVEKRCIRCGWPDRMEKPRDGSPDGYHLIGCPRYHGGGWVSDCRCQEIRNARPPDG